MRLSPTKTSGSRARFALLPVLCALSLGLLVDGTASGQGLQGELDSKESRLDEQKRRKGVLASELADYSAQVDRLAGQVAVLRNREARNRIAAKRDELARTRAQAEQREAELASARDSKAAALETVSSNIGELEDDVSHLNDKIEEQLRQAEASTTTTDPLPAGPIKQTSGGLVMPVEGVFTSPFGFRWGRLHAGIDLAVPEGTPIRAAKSGTVALSEYYGGYGNYTCIDHGGGLSTCYGHQSGFAVGSGDSVYQGEVIGYSGNTGSSTGPHLHFEVRVNGTPVDPMGYL